MAERFKPYHPEQTFLLPPSLRDWLPQGHLAYFLSDLVDELDLSQVYAAYRPADSAGQPAFHPRIR
jgi:transposase